MEKKLHNFFNTLKTIDFIEVLDNVTMEWALVFGLVLNAIPQGRLIENAVAEKLRGQIRVELVNSGLYNNDPFLVENR